MLHCLFFPFAIGVRGRGASPLAPPGRGRGCPAPSPQIVACGCRDRNVVRATVGGEFPICTLSVAQRVPRSTLLHVSTSPPTIPDGRLSRVRFGPRLCTPLFRHSLSWPMGG